MSGVLQQAKNLHFSPGTIIDVGAAYGHFSLECATVFPDVRYILIEPLKEYAPFLETATKSLSNGEHIQAAAASQPGEVTINVHNDLVGSSLYLEHEDSSVNGIPRVVSSISLDSLIDQKGLQPPFFIKIDVQGAELDVLAGAEKALSNSEYVLLEVSFFQFFEHGPQFHDVISFMKSRGFVVYDIYGLQYRPLDKALSQADVAFVREDGAFRTHHYYATRSQREQQDQNLKPQYRSQ